MCKHSTDVAAVGRRWTNPSLNSLANPFQMSGVAFHSLSFSSSPSMGGSVVSVVCGGCINVEKMKGWRIIG